MLQASSLQFNQNKRLRQGHFLVNCTKFLRAACLQNTSELLSLRKYLKVFPIGYGRNDKASII